MRPCVRNIFLFFIRECRHNIKPSIAIEYNKIKKKTTFYELITYNYLISSMYMPRRSKQMKHGVRFVYVFDRVEHERLTKLRYYYTRKSRTIICPR